MEAANSTIQLRSDHSRKIEREFAALREDLEEALARASFAGERRSVRERLRTEEQAALRYQSRQEMRQAYGMVDNPSSIKVISSGY